MDCGAVSHPRSIPGGPSPRTCRHRTLGPRDQTDESRAPCTRRVGVTSIGALVVNLFCAYLLVSRRNAERSHSKAAWLSARNDAVVNVAMIAGALLTLVWLSIWPDVVLGAIIFVLNADAALKVWRTACAERSPGSAEP